jgi:hypothetical protein
MQKMRKACDFIIEAKLHGEPVRCGKPAVDYSITVISQTIKVTTWLCAEHWDLNIRRARAHRER